MIDYEGILAGSADRVREKVKAETAAAAAAEMSADQKIAAQIAFLDANVRPELDKAVDALSGKGIKSFITQGEGLRPQGGSVVSLDFVVGYIPTPLPGGGFREYTGDRAVFQESNGRVDVTMEPWQDRGATIGHKVPGSSNEALITAAVTQAIDSYTQRNTPL